MGSREDKKVERGSRGWVGSGRGELTSNLHATIEKGNFYRRGKVACR